MSSMSKIAVFIKSKAKPGQRDALRAAWDRHLRARAESDPVFDAYYYCYDNDDPDTVMLFEVYNDAAAMAANAQGDALAAFMAEAGPLLDGFPEVHQTTPVWIKGG